MTSVDLFFLFFSFFLSSSNWSNQVECLHRSNKMKIVSHLLWTRFRWRPRSWWWWCLSSSFALASNKNKTTKKITKQNKKIYKKKRISIFSPSLSYSLRVFCVEFQWNPFIAANVTSCVSSLSCEIPIVLSVLNFSFTVYVASEKIKLDGRSRALQCNV